MTEDELERAIAADPDADVDVDWTKARLVLPQRKESIHLRVDPEVLHWFRQQGRGGYTDGPDTHSAELLLACLCVYSIFMVAV